MPATAAVERQKAELMADQTVTSDTVAANGDLAERPGYHLIVDVHDDILTMAEAIPPLPGSVVQLATVIAAEDTVIDDVVEVVQQDPGLTAAVLAGANSAASASQSEIVTIDAALMRIGMARCLALACGDSLGPRTTKELNAYGLPAGAHWQHSVIASFVAQAIFQKLKGTVGAEVVTTALLHGVGCAILNGVLDSELFAGLTRHMPIEMAERELLDVDHAEVGGLLLEMWGVPDVIAHGVANQFQPAYAPDDAATVVGLATHIAHHLHPGPNPVFRDTDEMHRLADGLGLDIDDVIQQSMTLLVKAGVVDSDQAKAA